MLTPYRLVAAAGLLALLSAPGARAAGTGVPAAATSLAPAAATVAPALSKTHWHLDPYDANLGLNIPLTDKPIPTIQSGDEAVIFRDLMQDSLLPHYMLLQADVYPVPVLGTWLKARSPHTYNKADLANTGVNLIESSGTSFQEPWAVSAFFGNIANLQRPGEAASPDNLGYCGWLVAAGNQHLQDNVLVQDDWYKLEWRVTGDVNDADARMSWSLRVGSKFNANPYITDVTYLGFERTNMDFQQPFLSWLKNSHLDVELSFSHDGGRVVREELVVGKKYPMPERGYSFTLDVGFVWDSLYEYSGPLRQGTQSQYTLVFQPGIQF